MLFFPTACLLWLSQAIDTLEQQIDFPALEDGLYHWTDQLLPQLENLNRRGYEDAVAALSDYCETCLDLCHEMSVVQEPDLETLNHWRGQIQLACSAFSEAEQSLGQQSEELGLGLEL